MLENRVEILETGLREALLRLNQAGGIQLPHLPSSNPPSPTPANFLDHAHGLNYNITQALKELQAMKEEREKGQYQEQHEDSEHSDNSDSASRRGSSESTHGASSIKSEDLATPLTSPSNSPAPKALFLPSEISQPCQQSYPDTNSNLYQPYYDRQAPLSLVNFTTTTGPFICDELSLSWLDSVALDDTYDLSSLQNNDFSFATL